MSRPTIGGKLDYRLLTQVYRPRSFEAIRSAIYELADRGAGDHEIANVLELDVQQVRRILGAPRS
jgi:hypothetical protein